MSDAVGAAGVDDLIYGELKNKILSVNKQSDQFFVTNMASVQAVHARCGQVMDKRTAEYDLAEARAASAMDPMSTNYLLNQSIANQNSVQINPMVLLEWLRASQKS